MTSPLDAMMKMAAIAATAAAEPVPLIPVVKSGTPVDDALAVLAAEMNRRTADMAADLARMADEMEAMIFDGPNHSEDTKGS